MINEFAIGAYRGLTNLELKELKRVNGNRSVIAP